MVLLPFGRTSTDSALPSVHNYLDAETFDEFHWIRQGNCILAVERQMSWRKKNSVEIGFHGLVIDFCSRDLATIVSVIITYRSAFSSKSRSGLVLFSFPLWYSLYMLNL